LELFARGAKPLVLLPEADRVRVTAPVTDDGLLPLGA